MTKKGRSEGVETTGESTAVNRALTVNIEQVRRKINVICGFAPRMLLQVQELVAR